MSTSARSIVHAEIPASSVNSRAPRPVGASPTTRYPAPSYNERSTPAVYVFPVPANASTTCTP